MVVSPGVGLHIFVDSIKVVISSCLLLISKLARSIVVNGESLAQGKGETKKKAEQEASKNACEQLQITR